MSVTVAYVYDAVWPWETGGVQTRLWELGHRLAERGHDVHWYGIHYWDGPATITRDGITYHGVMAPRDLYVDGRRSIREAVEYAANVVGPLWRAEPDVVDCQGFPYFPAFSSRVGTLGDETTLLVTWHEVWRSFWTQYLGPVRGTVGRAVEKLVAKTPDRHVAVSERTRRDVAELGAGADLLPNGVDMATIGAVEPADADVDVVFVGRLIEEKGAHLVLEAVDRLRSERGALRCDVVGTGPERDRLERLIAERGLDDSVRLRGELPERADVLALLKAADVYALPSSREGFGITALESLACGTPVVTADHPRNAAAALVEDGHTGAVTERTAAGVADGVRAARTCAPSDCRAAAGEYDWDRLADDAEALYREVA